MPNIKILIKLFVLSFMLICCVYVDMLCIWWYAVYMVICCVYGDTIQAEVVLYLLVSLYTFLKMTIVGGRNM